MSYKLDKTQLNRELMRRGLTQRQLEKLAGLPPSSVSRSWSLPLGAKNFARLMAALAAVPVIEGADDMLVGEKRTASAETALAVNGEEPGHGTNPHR